MERVGFGAQVAKPVHPVHAPAPQDSKTAMAPVKISPMIAKTAENAVQPVGQVNSAPTANVLSLVPKDKPTAVVNVQIPTLTREIAVDAARSVRVATPVNLAPVNAPRA